MPPYKIFYKLTPGLLSIYRVLLLIIFAFPTGSYAEFQGIKLTNGTIILKDTRLIETEGTQVIVGINNNPEVYTDWSSLAASALNLSFLPVQYYQMHNHVFSGGLPTDRALVIITEPCGNQTGISPAQKSDCVMKKSAFLLKMDGQPIDPVSAIDMGGDPIPLLFPDKVKENPMGESPVLTSSNIVISTFPNEGFAPENPEVVVGFRDFNQGNPNKHEPKISEFFSKYLFNQLDFQFGCKAQLADFDASLLARATQSGNHYSKTSLYDHLVRQNQIIQVNMLYIPFESEATPTDRPDQTVLTWLAETMNDGEIYHLYVSITGERSPLSLADFRKLFIEHGSLNLKRFYEYLLTNKTKSDLFRAIKAEIIKQRRNYDEIKTALAQLAPPQTELRKSGTGAFKSKTQKSGKQHRERINPIASGPRSTPKTRINPIASGPRSTPKTRINLPYKKKK